MLLVGLQENAVDSFLFAAAAALGGFAKATPFSPCPPFPFPPSAAPEGGRGGRDKEERGAGVVVCLNIFFVAVAAAAAAGLWLFLWERRGVVGIEAQCSSREQCSGVFFDYFG